LQVVYKYIIIALGGDIMKNRGLKNRTAISNAIDTNLLKRLKEYSQKTDIPISKLLDKAIEEFLKAVNK
jgi:hypothetical protein